MATVSALNPEPGLANLSLIEPHTTETAGGGVNEEGTFSRGIQSLCHASLSSLVHHINVGCAEDATVSQQRRLLVAY